MSEAWPAIKIKLFEHVATGPSQSLLRVSGQGPRRGEPGNRPALVIDDGTKLRRFSPLPAPPDSGRVLRAAYAVPGGLIAHARAYWLDHDSGARTSLPVPEEGVARMVSGEREVERHDPGLPDAYDEVRRLEQRIDELEEVHARELRGATQAARAAEARIAEADARVSAAERRERAASEQLMSATGRADATQRRLDEVERELQEMRTRMAANDTAMAQARAAREPLEQELGQLRTGRRSLEREVDHARDQLRVMTNERDELSRQATAFDEISVRARERAAAAEQAHQKSSAALQEIEIWRAELERRLAATTTELGALKAAREADERELERLREALGRAPALAGDGGRERAIGGDSSETLAAQAAEIERLAAEVAALRARASDPR